MERDLGRLGLDFACLCSVDSRLGFKLMYFLFYLAKKHERCITESKAAKRSGVGDMRGLRKGRVGYQPHDPVRHIHSTPEVANASYNNTRGH